MEEARNQRCMHYYPGHFCVLIFVRILATAVARVDERAVLESTSAGTNTGYCRPDTIHQQETSQTTLVQRWPSGSSVSLCGLLSL